ncbi:leucine-rich repeat protein [Butyrivibrio sp. WCD3002]|uniref:leucine-rich repeat protein n=1 Tax=Butyrivibrio sp. WCD3002 TaxID=1280676 RepID=UPI000402952C|nr:leucine-rich repeat protein [Butyrivibrio sp. WCD3002]
MPQNLKKIGAKAFFDCKGLGEIKFSDGITEIGQEAFSGCSDLVFECLPNKLRIIGAKAFYKCNALDFICYSGGDLSRVGEKAFYVNSNLKTHLLTDNKTLKSYDWTGSNRLITESDLSWCKDFAYSIYGKELTLTKYNGNSENLIIYPDAYIDGQVYKKISLNKAVFESNNVVKSVTIRNGVSLIDTTSMFDSCTELKKVVLPDDLSCIDAYMFHDCANLESVTIPDSIVSISDYAFYNCKKLNIGRLPSKLQVIGNVAFYNCNKISINKLPDSLKDIGKQAFYNCYAIKEITYNGAELSNVGEKAFYSSQNIDTTLASESEALSEYDWNGSKRTIKHLVSKWIKGYEYVVNESSNKIYLNKYIGSEKSCIIPKIAYWHYDEYKVCLNNTTFSGNEEVEKVVIEDGVEVCNTDQLFNDCTNLTEVTISSDSLIVGEKMFKNCEKLRTVLIYSSVDRICDNAFYGCANLRTISLPVGIKAIGSNAFYGCRNLEDISLPEKIVDIGVGAFSGCSKLTIDMLPRELKTIGESAFYECKSLTSVYYDGISLSKIGKNAFFVSEQTRTTLHTTNYSLQAYDWSSDNREVTVFEDEWYKDYAYTLGDSIIFLGKYIGTDKDVVVPPYVYIDGKQLRVHISKDTFKENERITSVNIMDGVYIDGLGSSEYSTISYTFYRCSNLRKVVLPSVVAGIGEYSFAYCRNLEQVKIPKTVKTIGVGAFYNCDKLSLINLNDEVFLIGEKAFEGCGSLALESLPKRIRTIGKKAFANCKKINISEMPEGLTRIGDGAFLQCDSISSIKLPSAITQIDDNAFVECENLTRIEYSGDSLESIGANVFYIASTSKIKTELVTNNRLLRSYNWNANNRRINNGTYNVSFYLPSNEYLADVTVEYDSPIYVDVVNSITFRVEEGYSIGSWYTITDGGEKKEWDIEKDIVTNDIRLYASLSPNRYWVSFDSNGGESNDRKLEVTYDAKYGELPNLENRDGLIFDGWFTSDIGGERITSDSLVNIAADHILYAHWKKEGQDENPSGRETCERCQSEMQKIVELAFPSPEQRPYQAYYKCKVCGDEWRVYYDFLPSKCIYVDPYISKNPTEKDYGQIEFDGYFCEPYIPLYVEFASVHLDHNSVDLNIGEKKTISAEIMPHHVPKDKLIWRSSDPSVVTVDSIGNITAISEGYATIKVTAGDTWDFGSAVCSINVVNSNDITTQESNDSNAGTDNLEANTTNGLKPNEVFKDSSGITYKASVDATKVSVIAVKNKKSINIDATVALKGKLYPVAEISAKAFAGKKIQNVTINAKNLRKVNKNAFKGTKKLKKVTIRGIKKDSKVAKQIEKAVKKANKKVKIVYK